MHSFFRYLFEYHNWYKIILEEAGDENLNNYLSNPVNEYILVKRMGDLHRVLDSMVDQQNYTTSM